MADVITKTSVKHFLQLLNKNSAREQIRQNNIVKTFKTAENTTPSLMQSRFFSCCNNIRMILESNAGSTSNSKTFGMSHFLAGDLHIFKPNTYKQAQFDLRSERSMSRFASKKSPTHYYDVLGLSSNATQTQIKSAYYKMSKLHHPDVTECTKSHLLFTEINEAYEILGNLRKRRMYDKGVFSPADLRADTVVDEAAKDYTQAYRSRNSNFERGTRPPPPTGRSKIYNFDEFYRQHYNDMRERKASEYQEYIKYKAMVDEERSRKANNIPSAVVATTLSILFLMGFCIFFWDTNYDRDNISLNSQRKSDIFNNGSLSAMGMSTKSSGGELK